MSEKLTISVGGRTRLGKTSFIYWLEDMLKNHAPKYNGVSIWYVTNKNSGGRTTENPEKLRVSVRMASLL